MSRRKRSREMPPEERLFGLAVVTVLMLAAGFFWLPKNTNPLFVVSVLAGLAVLWWQWITSFQAIRRTYETRQQLAALTPVEFEQWCAHRLRELGYSVRHVGGQGDHGIDLFAEKDGELTVVQCKRFTGRRAVGEPQIRDLYGAMHAEKATHAIVMTAGYFTDDARAWARGKPIDLGMPIGSWGPGHRPCLCQRPTRWFRPPSLTRLNFDVTNVAARCWSVGTGARASLSMAAPDTRAAASRVR
ncbi:MAG: hypothetical protein E6J35_07330 [Chloroflexi bacterium]|nr:MAG: hypothetical protein E6J35_07330 [Chloroflexota bacterium]